MTWPDANQMAISKGGHLVTIGDSNENNYVYNISPTEQLWLGLSDQLSEGNWEWVTGEPLVYSNWSAGEPNGLTNENYALYWQANGEWNDAGDSNNLNRRFVLEFDAQTNYVWSPNGETTLSITAQPTATTTYTVDVTSGTTTCQDSVTITVNPTHEVSIDSTVCDSLLWYGNTYKSTGTYTETLQTATGCDSIVMLHLTINNSSEHRILKQIF